MVKVYLVVYYARRHCSGSTLACQNNDDWPYDIGDDPSFCEYLNGHRLTWGVCRTDVRNRLQPNDIVVFFSIRDSKDGSQKEYHLSAVATVEKKIRQSEIGELGEFGHYCNRLIRRNGSDDPWEHFERCYSNKHEHGDWVWRFADHCRLHKEQFDDVNRSSFFVEGKKIRGMVIDIASNYVIFSSDPSETVVLSKPQKVAIRRPRDDQETWTNTRVSNTIRRLTLDKVNDLRRRGRKKRHLMTTGGRFPHRQIVFWLIPEQAAKWRSDFVGFLGNEGLL